MENCKCETKDGCIVNNYYMCGSSNNGEIKPYYDDYIVGQEVLTNKRYNGKLVYRQLIQVDKLPKGACEGKPSVAIIIETGLDENAGSVVSLSGDLYWKGKYTWSFACGGMHISEPSLPADHIMLTCAYGGLHRLELRTTCAFTDEHSAVITLEYTKNANESAF